MIFGLDTSDHLRVRKDGGHPEGPEHQDPRSKNPHGHIPGVANPDGSPWLPIY